MDDQPPLSLPTTPADAAPETYPEAPPEGLVSAFPDTPLALSSATPLESDALAPASMRLVDTVVYRQGLVVALALLAGPAVCAVAILFAAVVMGALPVWAPLALLLWLPVLALSWGLLKSVRVSPDSLACGRPFGRWRVIPFEEIERMERRGLRLVVRARRGPAVVFTPMLLWEGAALRRRLLLALPLGALSGELRAEAQALSEGVAIGRHEGDISGIMTVRPRAAWPLLTSLGALLALALAGAAWLELAAPLSLALASCGALLALAMVLLCLWTIQEIFVSQKGLIINYRARRRNRTVYWARLRMVEYTPGELALILRGGTGVRAVTCAGPGLLAPQQARQMRGFINRYCESPVAPLGSLGARARR